MRYTKMLIPTLRQEPKDAEIKSHILLSRAGMIKKLSTGLYTFLPLGFRALQKVIQIIRGEMNNAGALEILPPFVTPAKLWKESGRYYAYGKELLRFKDRHDIDMLLGPTHEESFVTIVKETVQSYRGLPLNLYQINTKFRDEIRPRFGIMRCREFIMKDAYSFDADEGGLDKNYQIMRTAYRNIFKRCGRLAEPVEADTGAMGGADSEEFMVASSVGEEEIVKCKNCGYIANTERATAYHDVQMEKGAKKPETFDLLKEVETPNARTIEELTKFFQTTPDNFIKSILYTADDRPVMAIIRGDMEINETKLKNAIGAVDLDLADEDAIKIVTGAPVGFAGPVGVKDKYRESLSKIKPADTGAYENGSFNKQNGNSDTIENDGATKKNDKLQIIADESIRYMSNSITGANIKDTHLINVNIDRDFKPDKITDIELVGKDSLCPKCKTPLDTFRGIEVGHIFKLGYKYTKSMNVTFLDRDGEEKHPIMGCYGIGVGRTLAGIVEQSNDKNGIIWPMSIAPFEIIIIPTNTNDNDIMEAAEEIYKNLRENYEVIIDDRDERAGVKFKDADLIGIPIHITIGRSFINEKKFEVKLRHNHEKEYISKDDLYKRIGEIYEEETAKYSV